MYGLIGPSETAVDTSKVPGDGVGGIGTAVGVNVAAGVGIGEGVGAAWLHAATMKLMHRNRHSLFPIDVISPSLHETGYMKCIFVMR